MQFMHALVTAGIYAGIALVGGLFALHMATYRPNNPVSKAAPKTDPKTAPTKPTKKAPTENELFQRFNSMTLRELRAQVGGRVTGIRSMSKRVLAQKLAHAIAVTAT